MKSSLTRGIRTRDLVFQARVLLADGQAAEEVRQLQADAPHQVLSGNVRPPGGSRVHRLQGESHLLGQLVSNWSFLVLCAFPIQAC